jgi:hypothetical protein
MTLFAKYAQPVEESAIRVLNLPRQLEVEADEQGVPRAVWVGDAWLQVEAIGDVWRIDDEWWRERITRRYFRVTLAAGSIRTIYQDLATGEWYEQQY